MTLRRFFQLAACCLLWLASHTAHAGSYDDFFAAVLRDNPGTLVSLMRRGFDPNTLDPKGQPAITLAIRLDSTKAAQALLDQPSLDINALNTAGESALMLAALKGNLEWSQRLLDRGSRLDLKGWSPLHYAATGPNAKVVELLLNRGAPIDAESPNRSTPLMMAARYGSEDSVDLLLARGADPRRRNDRGLNAADFAKLEGREKLSARLEALAR